MCSVLGYQFRWPLQSSRVYPLYHPEIKLVALFIVATKLCFSTDGMSHLTAREATGPIIPALDWEKWQEAVNQPDSSETQRRNFENVNANKVATMTDADLDAYFNYVSSFVEKKSA